MLSLAGRTLVLFLVLACGLAASSQEPAPRFAYGYKPYLRHYGPVYAANELNRLGADGPHAHGLDYGYGLGYFFGYKPAAHRHLHARK